MSVVELMLYMHSLHDHNRVYEAPPPVGLLHTTFPFCSSLLSKSLKPFCWWTLKQPYLYPYIPLPKTSHFQEESIKISLQLIMTLFWLLKWFSWAASTSFFISSFLCPQASSFPIRIIIMINNLGDKWGPTHTFRPRWKSLCLLADTWCPRNPGRLLGSSIMSASEATNNCFCLKRHDNTMLVTCKDTLYADCFGNVENFPYENLERGKWEGRSSSHLGLGVCETRL